MSISLVGKKCGMTRLLQEDGSTIPVTVLAFSRNCVAGVKTKKKHGYDAVQVAVGQKSKSRLNKSQQGFYKLNKIEAAELLSEFRFDVTDESQSFEVGQELTVDAFQVGQTVDVTGISKGKGFQGGVKRHNFSMQDATHGNSVSHRALGSTGQCQTPGRVFKGKKMAGQMGNAKCTSQNLEIARVDAERLLVLVKGSVVGANNGYVLMKISTRHKVKGA